MISLVEGVSSEEVGGSMIDKKRSSAVPQRRKVVEYAHSKVKNICALYNRRRRDRGRN